MCVGLAWFCTSSFAACVDKSSSWQHFGFIILSVETAAVTSAALAPESVAECRHKPLAELFADQEEQQLAGALKLSLVAAHPSRRVLNGLEQVGVMLAVGVTFVVEVHARPVALPDVAQQEQRLLW
jgi:hypothetical protein